MRARRCAAVLAACAGLGLPAGASGADPLRGQQWGMDLIRAEQAHQTATGAGVTVAVLDTGILASHPDFAGALLPGRDFVQDDADPQDGSGHGTHVAGIIGARENGFGIEGVAPEAKILPVRVLDDAGAGDEQTIAEGIDYAVAQGADVINLSLGGLVGLPGPFADAISRAQEAGVVVVAAAGNDGLPICQQYDEEGSDLLCVGAVTREREVASYSSRGLGVDIFAPGGAADGVDANEIVSDWKTGAFEYVSGTSQAAPHVAGVAALLVQRGVRGRAAARRLVATADGNRILDAAAAVRGLTPPATGGGGGGTPPPTGGTGGTPGGGSSNGGGSPGGGSAGPDPGVPGAAPGTPDARRRAGATAPKRQRASVVLRRGLVVSCVPARSGRARVTLGRGGARLGRSTRALAAGKRTSFRVLLNRRGRAFVAAGRKRGVARNLVVVVAVPGAGQRRFVVRVLPS